MVGIGKVSKVNKKNGTIEVLYEDMDDIVTTSNINCLVSAGIPQIGDEVAVLYRDESLDEGLCLGKIYNENNPPGE